MTLLSPLPAAVAFAEIYWGRWVVRCPNPHCDNALMLPFGHPVYECAGPYSCTTRADVVWPPNPGDIVRILAMRPAPRNWNWVPGETLHDLLEENLRHGILPARPDQIADGVVFEITGDSITRDPLAIDTRRRLELGAH